MAKINYTSENQTLAKIDEMLELEQQLEKPRHYMGMSMIGDECWRKVFYDFRNCAKRKISASGIRAIQDGFAAEDVMIARLKKLKFIELHATDPANPGKQIGFSSLLGHLRGHADGIIKGIIEAPLTWHVWESKAVNEKKFDDFNKKKAELGEKNVLQAWDIVYYAQAQLYMHFSELDRHYITVMTPGGRNYTSARTEYDRKYAEMTIDKAKQLIFDNWSLPARANDNREYFKCKWCQFQEICHDGDIPDVHCKTCRYRECVDGGQYKCLLNDSIIDETMLNIGCDYHIFNPALIQAKLIDQQDSGCVYVKDGVYFSNNNISGMPTMIPEIEKVSLEIYTSKHLKEKIKSVNNITAGTAKIMKAFDGTMNTEKKWQGPQTTDARLKDI